MIAGHLSCSDIDQLQFLGHVIDHHALSHIYCKYGFLQLLFFALNVPTLIVSELLLGFRSGIFQTLAVADAAEVCPIILCSILHLCQPLMGYRPTHHHPSHAPGSCRQSNRVVLLHPICHPIHDLSRCYSSLGPPFRPKVTGGTSIKDATTTLCALSADSSAPNPSKPHPPPLTPTKPFP